MRKPITVEELEIIKDYLEYELVERAEANIEHYTDEITSDMEDEEEIEMVRTKCDNFYRSDLECLFGILITNHLNYLINKYHLVVENGEVDFDLMTPIYTEYMTKYLENKLYEVKDSETNEVYGQFISDHITEYYREIRDNKLSLIGIRD